MGEEDMIELRNLTPTTSQSGSVSLPTYADATDAGAVLDVDSPTAASPDFVPTVQLQIHARGKELIGLPFPLPADPTPVYAVEPSGQLNPVPVYISLRPSRRSGNCMLVRGNDEMQVPISSTIYRFGPGKNPVVRLLNAPAGDPNAFIDSINLDLAQASSASAQPPAYDGSEFEITGAKSLSRAKAFRTPLGTFEWRYGSRKERRSAGADNQLILERITTIALAGGKKKEQRQKVAQLIRNDETRTPGSHRSSAGNGGRLLIDMREWSDAKRDAEDMKVIIVATALSMLKKEVDRRRMHQIMAFSAVAAGC
jgi:hypothetical protein